MELNDHLDPLSLEENFEDFFQQALCGYLTTDHKAYIRKANLQVSRWTGIPIEELPGKRFSDLFTTGGKIYYETHLAPLLQMQGYFDEVALELRTADKQYLKVLVNALAKRNEAGAIVFVRFTILKASDRHRYEDNLRKARSDAEQSLSDAMQMATLREQFIAVLGHDLRNPLGSITVGAALLEDMSDEAGKNIAGIISRSARRMQEMISNILDFAQARLGGGLNLIKANSDITPVLLQVIDELQVAWPDRKMNTHFVLPQSVYCDPHRVAQLFSNLLANALTHGDAATPIEIFASQNENGFELTVTNGGNPIPESQVRKLFEPFSRENARPSQNGLGLGLYIASQIALAHGGTLAASSTPAETRFTLRLP